MSRAVSMLSLAIVCICNGVLLYLGSKDPLCLGLPRSWNCRCVLCTFKLRDSHMLGNCPHHFSLTVVKHYDVNLKKKEFLRCLQLQRASPWPLWWAMWHQGGRRVGGHCSRDGQGASLSTSGRQKELTANGAGFWSIRACPMTQLLILSRRCHPLRTEHSSLWAHGGHSHSNHHSS